MKIGNYYFQFRIGLFYLGFSIYRIKTKDTFDVPISFFIGFHWFINRFQTWGFTFHFAFNEKDIRELNTFGYTKEIGLWGGLKKSKIKRNIYFLK